MPTQDKKERGNPIFNDILKHYSDLFKEKYQVAPEIPWGWTGKMLKDLLERHSAEGLKKVITLYFKDEARQAHHIGTILSAWSINTYLPKARLDPRVYSNADEYNKDIY